MAAMLNGGYTVREWPDPSANSPDGLVLQQEVVK